MIWDIGEIANANNPNKLRLVHDIMLASSAVPGLFQPGKINVTIDGQQYQESHVDGGVTPQLVLYPLDIDRSVIELMNYCNLERTLHIIRNSKVGGDFEAVLPDFFNITRRSTLTLIKYQGMGDLLRLHYACL